MIQGHKMGTTESKIFINRDELNKRVEQGLIRRVPHPTDPDIHLYNYTEQCQFGKHWDDYTLASRGLVVDYNGRIISLPFGKFFNFGELSFWVKDAEGNNINCVPAVLPVNTPFEVFEKVDGSLGIWYHYKGEWHVSTRGCFDNEFTQFAKAHWQEKMTAIAANNKDLTFLTEICMPTQHDLMIRGVKHKPGIYLLGARDMNTGHDVSWRDFKESGLLYRWRLAGGYLPTVHEGSLEQILQWQREHKDTEGWVVRWQDGTRCKIKTEWYLNMVASMTDLRPTVIKCMTDVRISGKNGATLIGKMQLKDILKLFPEELHEDVTRLYQYVQFNAAQEMRHLHNLYGSVLQYHGQDRKTFAAAAFKCGKEDGYFLMKLYDGEPIYEKIVENIGEKLPAEIPQVLGGSDGNR